MRISHIHIENFRNFRLIDVPISEHAVILGENKVGKSNLIFALRLLLDPSLPESARELRIEDLWDGIEEPTKDDHIIIWVELTDFEQNENQLAVLAEHLVQPEPMVSRLTYVWKARPELEGDPHTSSDYEWFIYGGDRPENRVGYEVRRRIPMDVVQALRDCEGDLNRWSRSPLKPLLDRAAGEIEREELDELAKDIDSATQALTDTDAVAAVAKSINDKLVDMVGTPQALETVLQFSPTDPDRLIRALRMYIDAGKRAISDASLGSANVLYFALKMLEYDQLVEQGDREHTFFAVEEPEAHLHPHLQRLIFRNYLRTRAGGEGGPDDTTVLLTTHSPHVASIAPLNSFVVLRRTLDEGTQATSTAATDFSEEEVADLERYIDVNRAELLFAKGVILVEGEAERFMIPVLAKRLGFDLDELGITICSVGGTYFGAYLKLIGPKGLNVPYAVLTDRDRQVVAKNGKTIRVSYGYRKYRKTWRSALGKKPLLTTDSAETVSAAEEDGVFFNEETFEIELFGCGHGDAFLQAAEALSTNSKLKERFEAWAEDCDSVNGQQLIKDIETISKGRFAQRLASIIAASDDGECPEYIKKGLTRVKEQCE